MGWWRRRVMGWKIVTSAGIDMSLHVVARLYGPEVARATARGMEYDYWEEK